MRLYGSRAPAPARTLRGLAHEIAKFGTIGVINLVVNFAVFNLLALTVFRRPTQGEGRATIVATTCAYFMNRHWTYRDRPKSTLRREYTLFFFFNLVGLVIEVASSGWRSTAEHDHLLALNLFTAVGIGLGTIFRFWSYRTHVFRPAPEMPETAAAAEARGRRTTRARPGAIGPARRGDRTRRHRAGRRTAALEVLICSVGPAAQRRPRCRNCAYPRPGRPSCENRSASRSRPDARLLLVATPAASRSARPKIVIVDRPSGVVRLDQFVHNLLHAHDLGNVL